MPPSVDPLHKNMYKNNESNKMSLYHLNKVNLEKIKLNWIGK